MIPGITTYRGLAPRVGSLAPAAQSPTDIALSANTIDINASGTTTIGTLSATDADSSSFTWTIVTQPSGLTLDLNGTNPAATIVLRYVSGTLTLGDTTVRIRADDGTSTPYEENITLTVFDPAAAQLYTVGILDTQESGARTNVPWMAGVPLKTGFVAGSTDSAGNTLAATIGGSATNIGIGARCTDRSGKLTYAVVGGVLPSLASGGTTTVVVNTAAGSDPAGTAITWADVLAAQNHLAQTWNLMVEVDAGGVTYVANPRTMATTDTTYSVGAPHYHGTFISSPHITCFSFTVPLKDGSANLLNDQLRARFDVYAWKVDAGAVGGGNPIIAIRADVELDMGSWAISPRVSPEVTAIRVKNHAGTVIQTYTGSPTFYLHSYAAADLGLLDGVWWSNTADERGGWEVIPENVGGRIDYHVATGWSIQSSHTAALVTDTMTAINSTWGSAIDLPFNWTGSNFANQGSGSIRPEINLVHSIEVYAWASWTTAIHRAMAKRNFSAALTQPLRYVLSGRPLDPGGTEAAHKIYNATQLVSPSVAYKIALDSAHAPFDGFYLYLIYGRLKYLRHMQFAANRAWVAVDEGVGYDRRLLVAGQTRLSAWNLRTFSLTAAATPDDMTYPIGTPRQEYYTLLDHQNGTANNASSYGRYHGTKNEYWDASRAGAVPLSGTFDNDDPNNARYIHTGIMIGPAFQWQYMCLAQGAARRLNVLNADGLSWFEWWASAFKHIQEVPHSDWLSEMYNAPLLNDAGVSGIRTWPQIARAWSRACSKLHRGQNQAVIRGSHIANLASYSLDITTPSAAILSLEGTGFVPYFQDGEAINGDWFLGTGAWNDGIGATWASGQTSGNQWAGEITAVALDGKSCTLDLTVADALAPPSSIVSSSDINKLALPAYGPNSPWWAVNTLIPGTGATDDYTNVCLAGAYALQSASPAVDYSTVIAQLRARQNLRGPDGGNNKIPPSTAYKVQWLWGDWS